LKHNLNGVGEVHPLNKIPNQIKVHGKIREIKEHGELGKTQIKIKIKVIGQINSNNNKGKHNKKVPGQINRVLGQTSKVALNKPIGKMNNGHNLSNNDNDNTSNNIKISKISNNIKEIDHIGKEIHNKLILKDKIKASAQYSDLLIGKNYYLLNKNNRLLNIKICIYFHK
jgi:hypothetical protein